MQNLEVDVTIKKNRKSKDEINKDLEESVINGERNETQKCKKKLTNLKLVRMQQKLFSNFQEQKSDTTWLTYEQRRIFHF